MAGQRHTETGVRGVDREGALLREILGEDAAERSGTLEVVAERETPADRSARTVDLALDGLGLPRSFRFEEDRVKGCLDDLLLALVAVRGEETHGKGLMSDLARLFDTTTSPGTVYPRLHDLTAAGLLEPVELVRTKEYHPADEAAVRERLQRSMHQHLALAAVFEAALATE